MQQPNLFSSETPHGSPSQAEAARAEIPKQDARLRQPGIAREGRPLGGLWFRRLDLFLRVMVRLYLGLLLIALPWMHFWSQNHFFTLYPSLGTFAENGAVRGMVSGLGLLNVWIAISEALHSKDLKA